TDPWGTSQTSAEYQKLSLFADVKAESKRGRSLHLALSNALNECRPDVMAINGWNDFGSLIAVKCCVDRGIPLALMSESTAGDERRVRWKELVKRQVVRLYSTALVGGQRHIDYLLALGMPRERIFTGYDVIDNNYFRQKAEE